MSKESLRKAREARKPIVLYECPDYFVESIPLNYRATIKCAIKPEHWHRSMDREYYSDPKHGLDTIKEIAEYQIKQWFMSGVATEPSSNLKPQKPL